MLSEKRKYKKSLNGEEVWRRVQHKLLKQQQLKESTGSINIESEHILENLNVLDINSSLKSRPIPVQHSRDTSSDSIINNINDDDNSIHSLNHNNISNKRPDHPHKRKQIHAHLKKIIHK